jgi:hypothetical protein
MTRSQSAAALLRLRPDDWWETVGVTARDVLHRLVDDLDEEDAEVLALVAADQSEAARLITAIQAKALKQLSESGIWPEQAQIALRRSFEELKDDPRRSAVITLVLAVWQDVQREVAAALTSRPRDPANVVPAAAERALTVADALGSVRAEGLEPTAAAFSDFASYEAGRVMAEDLYESALRRARSITPP